MKNLSWAIIIILLVALIVMFFYAKSQNVIIKEQKQEILASSRYIDNLKSKLLELDSSGSGHDNRDDLKHLLEEFLKNGEPVDSDIDLYETIQTIKSRDRFIPNYIPVSDPYEISQRFSGSHKGLDFATELGREVYSAAAGEIIKITYDDYFGNMIVVDHFNGYLTVYAHLAKSLTEFEEFVKKGDVIGLVGSTGNSSGPHLHFEILKKDINIDPEEILNFTNGA